MPTNWTNYKHQIERCKPRMIKVMQELALKVGLEASDVYDDDMDDFRVGFSIKGKEQLLDVSFQIWDSGDADDGIYGKHGNFVFDIVEEGGRIIASCIPENYSNQVWVDYQDDKEWDKRLDAMIMGMDSAIKYIEDWKENDE